MRGLKILAIMLVLLAALCGCSNEKVRDVTVYEVGTTQADEIESTTEERQSASLVLVERTEHENVELVTSYCTLSFPSAYSDLIDAEISDDGKFGAINFYARLTGGRYPIFTLSFSGEGDSRLGTLEYEGENLTVCVTFAQESHDLSEDDSISFRAAQERFNEIYDSLNANEGFTPE